MTQKIYFSPLIFTIIFLLYIHPSTPLDSHSLFSSERIMVWMPSEGLFVKWRQSSSVDVSLQGVWPPIQSGSVSLMDHCDQCLRKWSFSPSFFFFFNLCQLLCAGIDLKCFSTFLLKHPDLDSLRQIQENNRKISVSTALDRDITEKIVSATGKWCYINIPTSKRYWCRGSGLAVSEQPQIHLAGLL